ncbi:unnamed protein product [Blepharisma stoltei]|uniref:Lipid-binding serum glycoprotein C-terminal domain-containing protein n=1 Tax=Blepharisma stoltei TaxID=1481888 RepID=A0AAU9I984_9CILI|nr:unnamed protein product [Blepharisma stoltei]
MIIFCCLLAFALSDSDQNSLNLAFRQDKAQEIFDIIVHFSEGYFKNYDLGNYSIPISYSGFKGSVALTNITIADLSLDLDKSGITFGTPNQIKTIFENINLLLSFKYHLKVSFIDKSGSGSLDVYDTSLNTDISIYKKGVPGIPAILLDFFKLSIGSVKLKTDLSNVLNNLIQKAIEEEIPLIEKQTYELAQNYTTLANEELAKISYEYSFENYGVSIDYYLAKNTSVLDNYFCTALTGKVFNESTGEPFIPFFPSELPDVSDVQLPYQLFLSDYLISSLIIGFWPSWNYSLNTLPPSFPIKLTTDGLAFLIPNFKETYGKGKSVHISFAPATSSSKQDFSLFPSYFTDKNINFNATVQVDFLVEDIKNQWVDALIMNLPLFTVFQSWVKNDEASITVQNFDIRNIEVINSEVGTIDINNLEKALSTIINIYLPIFNNDYSDFNITFPEFKYFKISQDFFAVHQGYLEADADLEINL